MAQQAGDGATPAPVPAPAGELPAVDVIQKKAEPAPAVAKKSTPKTKAVVATPAPPALPPVAPTPVAAVPAAGSNEGLVQMAPLPGSEIPIAKIPRGVSTMNSSDIKRDGSVIPQEFLNSRIPGVMVDDLQGNQFQTGIQYRGFVASPVNGLPQGLAVYQNGVRINESFGDTVNWDFIPTNAVEGITVMGSNPVFGLNAIGGALSIIMKDGFSYQGAEIDTRVGMFGRRQVGAQAGAQSGGIAIYGAFEGINDDGFRDFSGTEERRGYADLGFKGTGSEFHLNYTGAVGEVGVTAAVPEELLAFGGQSRTFTSPQITDNNMQMFSANGVVELTPTLALSGTTYYRHFRQKHIDGNISEFDECEPPADVFGTDLCTEGGAPIFGVGANGALVGLDDNDLDALGVLGSIDKTGQDANSYGVALQAAENARLFGMHNSFVVGSSYDHGNVKYQASSELGFFLPKYVVQGTGTTLSGDADLVPGDPDKSEEFNASEVTPRSLTTLNDYVGIYAADTIDLTDSLSLTLGGRWNYARVEIQNTGAPSLDKLNGTNKFYRFNPSAGLTYKVAPGLSVYGGYSEANRAPTASEIACSDPENPCIIESALASDPPLKQVVSRTWETGLRGGGANWNGAEHFDWSFGLFRTANEDDIIQIADKQQGRGYFANAGDTLRQGIEASATYRAQRWMAYTSYAYVDATFQSSNIIASENNPQVTTECEDFNIKADDDDAMCLEITPGNRMPGVPRHRFKAGLDYLITPDWLLGADLIAVSNQIFYGDEANLDKPLPGYARVNLHSSYNVTRNVQLYGLIENLFDEEYGIYGTYFNTKLAQEAGPGKNGKNGPDPSLNGLIYDKDNARTITPAIPFAAYGGIRVRF
jgi:outer membrane receptor protein involved in Fe transport